MSSPKRRLELARAAAHRAGEGALIDVELHADAQVAGQTKVSVGINLESAQVPDRRYVADVANAAYSDETVKLFFGQKKLGSSELRSLLIINFPPDKVQQFLSSVDVMQQPSLDEIIKVTGLSEGTLEEINSEPGQTTSLVSNVLGVGVSGREACLDFYHISPFSIVKIPSTHKVAIDPVVRVHLRTSIFAALVKRLRKLNESVPKEEGARP